MADFDLFGKLDDILYAPVDLITDYLREPLRKKQKKRETEAIIQVSSLEAQIDQEVRNQESIRKQNEEKNRAEIEIQRQKNEAEIEIQKQKNEAEIKLQQMQEEASLEMQKKENDARLQMEMQKFNIEMDAIVAKQEEERRNRLVESIKRYRIDLANAMKDIVDSIGTMSLELHQKAYDLVTEKTKEFKKIQDEAKNSSVAQIKEAQIEFMKSDPETYRKVVNEIMDERNKMVDAADRFILGLSEDLKRINETTSVIITTGMDNINQTINNSITTASLLGNTSNSIGLTDKKSSDIIDISE